AGAGSKARVVMGVRHRSLPVEGVQFHPEAVLSEGGHRLLANWLATRGLPEARHRAPALEADLAARQRAAFPVGVPPPSPSLPAWARPRTNNLSRAPLLGQPGAPADSTGRPC